MWWILILVVTIGIVLVSLTISFSNKEQGNHKTYSSYNPGDWKKVEMSEYAKKYKPRPGFKNGNPRFFESDGRRIFKYRIRETTFSGYSGERVLKNVDDTEIYSFFKSTFFGMLNDEELTQKCKKIKSVVSVENRNLYTVDCDFFFKNSHCGVFPFNNVNELACDELLVYFKNRKIKIIEMPTTKYSDRYRNYAAIIDLNNYKVLSLLSYLLHKTTNPFSSDTFGFYSSRTYKSCVDNREDMIECIYSILSKPAHPRLDWDMEVVARCLSGEGWPRPFELRTEYETFKLEAANAGLIEHKSLGEAKLFTLVRSIYNDALFQYYNDWLEPLSLDIFIPSLNTAIEFQGGQHDKPVKYFGGKEKYVRILENDSRKRELCKNKNIKLIEWPYDLEINEANLKRLLNK